jgi:hypothetical protein
MAIYITQGRADAVKGMVASPENREKAVADLMEKAGAKLLAQYFWRVRFPLDNRGAERRGHGLRAKPWVYVIRLFRLRGPRRQLRR